MVETWGESVRRRREGAGLSMERLAALASVSRATIANIEIGEPCREATKRAIDRALESGSVDERISRLENEVAELRRDLAVLLGFAQQLTGQQQSQPSAGPAGRRTRR